MQLQGFAPGSGVREECVAGAGATTVHGTSRSGFTALVTPAPANRHPRPGIWRGYVSVSAPDANQINAASIAHSQQRTGESA